MTLISLPDLPRAVAALSGRKAPKYQRVYNGAVSNEFPAEKIEGHWYVRDDNLDVVARALEPAGAGSIPLSHQIIS